MIVKKLRLKKHWSQEQLATMAGISERTVQRIEAGHSASLDTLKSIAAVFEVDIKLLCEEITVIDKTTEAWSRVPLWVSFGVWGIKTRATAMRFELFCALLGVIGFVSLWIKSELVVMNVFWGSAYWYAAAIRWLDNQHMW